MTQNALIVISPEFYTKLVLNILVVIAVFVAVKQTISFTGLPRFVNTAARMLLILAVVLLVGISFWFKK